MHRLESVLGGRAPHLARILVSELGFSEERAEELVMLAGVDLMESYRWRARDMAGRNLSAPENVRELLGAIRGDRIANSLGLPASEVWSGLRAIVPRVLQLADRSHLHEA